LRSSGHDVATVRDEGLGGASDITVFETCLAEERTLITLDHDFGNVLRFPPESSYGIVILEVPGRLSEAAIVQRLKEFLAIVATRPLRRELWIVEPGRVRIHQRETGEP
jgi:predicted nuclease of predicted toxin-antitoxin system